MKIARSSTTKRNKDPNGESMRQSLIVKFLRGIPRSRLLRQYNCAPYSPGKGRFMRSSNSLTPLGLPDLQFISKNYGVHFFEVKSQKAYNFIQKHLNRIKGSILKSHQHTKKQILMIEELNSLGVKAHFVCDVEQVKRAIGHE